MDSFPSSQLTTSRGFSYRYIHIAPQGQENEYPYILFLHGFPSSSHDWRHQIQYFSKKGYGILAPDLLGYGGTSKPLDLQAYKGKDMAQDIIEILDHEKIEKVLGVAHDWGSYLLSRLANYHPSRCSQYAFLDVGYSVPGHDLSTSVVKHINSAVQTALGFSIFGYFLFFNDPDAIELLDKNPESVASLFYSTDATLGKQYMGAENGFRTWLTEGKIAPEEKYISHEDIALYKADFAPENGGHAAAVNWYRAQLQSINTTDDKKIPPENYILHQPTLLINTNNFITFAADFGTQMEEFTTEFVQRKIQSGHWIMLEKPDEVNLVLGEFFYV